MKRIRRVFFLTIILALTGCTGSQNVYLETLDNFENENTSLFTIRNIQSGFMIINIPDQHGREIGNWQVVPINTPVDVLVNDPSGWIQFKDPSSNQCLSVLNGRSLSKSECNYKNKETLFVLIPSTSRAVQIKSVSSQKCITDKGNDSFFHLENCVADFNRPNLVIPTKNLWMLNPPISSSMVAPTEQP